MAAFPIFLMTFFSSQFGFGVQKTFETPESSDYFLQQPLSFDLDSKGNLYVVDGEAKVVFVWDSNGKFLRTIGKPGQGPGEFAFSGRGPAMGWVFCLKDQLYVFDGVQRKLSVFNPQGEFLRAPTLNLPRSRIQNFNVLSENEYLMLIRRFDDDHFVSSIKILNAEGKDVKILKDIKDNTVSFKMENGRPSNMTMIAYNPGLVMGYNPVNEKTYVAFSGEPVIEVLSRDGKTERIEVPLVQRDITAFDKAEFTESRAGSDQRRPVKFTFPEKMPCFQQIYPLANGDIMVFEESPFSHKVEGVLLNATGNLKGKVSDTLGEGGGLLNGRGQLLRFSLNQDDEFEVSIVVPAIKES